MEPIPVQIVFSDTIVILFHFALACAAIVAVGAFLGRWVLVPMVGIPVALFLFLSFATPASAHSIHELRIGQVMLATLSVTDGFTTQRVATLRGAVQIPTVSGYRITMGPVVGVLDPQQTATWAVTLSFLPEALELGGATVSYDSQDVTFGGTQRWDVGTGHSWFEIHSLIDIGLWTFAGVSAAVGEGIEVDGLTYRMKTRFNAEAAVIPEPHTLALLFLGLLALARLGRKR